MKSLIETLALLEELEKDRRDLLLMGLTEEEVEGYKEFFAEEFLATPLPQIKGIN